MATAGGVFIWCTYTCFDLIDQNCQQNNNKCTSNYDEFTKDIEELKCRNMKFRICLPLCANILVVGSCIADMKQCLANEVILRVKNNVFK